MRRLLPLCFFAAAALGAAAAEPEPVLPAAIPGYELRVLDVRKPVLFEIEGRWVRASLPVFLYYPTGALERRRADLLLRQAYDRLLELSRQPDWSAEDLRSVLLQLDGALRALEKGSG